MVDVNAAGSEGRYCCECVCVSCVCVCACVYLTSPDDHLFLNTFSHIIFNYMDKTYTRIHVPEYIWTKQHRGCP